MMANEANAGDPNKAQGEASVFGERNLGIDGIESNPRRG